MPYESAPPWWPSNELERRLTLATQDRSAEAAFFETLLNSKLWVFRGDDTEIVMEGNLIGAGSRLSLPTVELEGTKAVIAFTSETVLNHHPETREGMSWLAIGTQDLMKLVGDRAILVNPDGPYGKLFTRDDITVLLSGLLPTENGLVVGNQGAKCELGALAARPSRLLEELKILFHADSRVSRAICCGIRFGAEPVAHPLILIRTHGPWNELSNECGKVVDRWCQEHHMPVDLMNAEQSGIDPRALKEYGEVFYSRPWWRL